MSSQAPWSFLGHAVRLGYAPFAPHLLYPGALNDAIEEERTQGIQAGLSFLSVCQELWWLQTPKGITSGMQKELELADFLDMTIRKVYLTKDDPSGFLVTNGRDGSWKLTP